MHYTTLQTALYNNLPAIIHVEEMQRERYLKLNMLFAAFMLVTFTLANLPMEVLDCMALTESAGGQLI